MDVGDAGRIPQLGPERSLLQKLEHHKSIGVSVGWVEGLMGCLRGLREIDGIFGLFEIEKIL